VHATTADFRDASPDQRSEVPTHRACFTLLWVVGNDVVDLLVPSIHDSLCAALFVREHG